MTENVFLFVPNIIGYLRATIGLLLCLIMSTCPYTTAFLYLFAQVILDHADGIAARKLNQVSKFGATLDITIDQCTIAVFCMGLCTICPILTVPLQFIVFLDILRCWMALSRSAVKQYHNHKNFDQSPLLTFYYSDLGQLLIYDTYHIFLVALYLLHFFDKPHILGISLWQWIAVILFPIVMVKQVVNLVMLRESCKDIVNTADTAGSRKKNGSHNCSEH